MRVNLHPFRHLGPAPDFRFRDPWWATLDWIVTNALASDLTVILDLHEFGALGNDAAGNKPRFLAFWQQVAPRWQPAE